MASRLSRADQLVRRTGAGHHRLTAAAMAIAIGIGSNVAGAEPRPTAIPEVPLEASQGDSQQTEAVVISGKRAQRQRDIAGTVSGIDGHELERGGARSQEDIFKRVAGVQINQGQPNQALPTMRGIGTVGNSDLLGTQQATTGFYIDDVPFTDPFGFVGNADIAPFDLERVEVLRGPQGVLYGSASLGGAVNYVLNRPDLHGMGSSTLAAIGSVRSGGLDHSVYAMLNAPLQPGVAAVRVVAFDRRDSGYITNLGTGQDNANRLRQRGGRISATLRPGSGQELTAAVLTQRTENDDSFAVSPDPGQLSVNTPTASWRSNEFTLGKLQLNLALSERHSLTSISAYLDKRASYVTDTTRSLGALGAVYGPVLGAGPLPALPQVTSLSARPLWSRALSQELRIASAGTDALQYVAGALVQHTRFDWRGLSVAPGGEALWGTAGALLSNDLIGAMDVRASTTESAVFADADYLWRHGLSLGVGGRAYRTTLDYDADVSFLGRTTPTHATSREQGFTPKLSVKYRFGEQMAYLLASKGYRFGGVNLNPPQMSPYRSDSLWNHEIGLRLVPHPTLRLDLSAFVLEWTNAQVSTLLAGPVPFIGVANVGQARSRGLEAALNWAASRRLRVVAGLAFTDARTTAAYTSSSGTPVASGARLPGTPRWQTNMQANQAFDGPAGWAGHVTASYAYVGPRVFDIEARSHASGYSLLDLRISFARGRWEWSAAVNNVLDARGVGGASAIYRPGLASYTDYYLVRPRHVGFSLRHDI